MAAFILVPFVRVLLRLSSFLVAASVAVLAEDAIRGAIKDFAKKNNVALDGIAKPPELTSAVA